MKTLIIALFLSALSSSKLALAECATDLNSLAAVFHTEEFSSRWVETGARDGQPLVVTITPERGGLFLQFVKTGAGLWASGTADICNDRGGVTATISGDQIKLGPAAPFLLRMGMGGGATFRLSLQGSSSLQISASGWSGRFAPSR